MKRKPIVILGAGLSGLACAMTLSRKGIPYLILEKETEIGGRVKTSHHEGFSLDHGFQVLLNSYPELPGFLDLEKLNLRKFNSGAMIFNGAKMSVMANPVLHPTSIIASVVDQGVSFTDKTQILALIAKSQMHRENKLTSNQSTFDYLKESGFTQDFIEFFWRPFLAGVFLDEKLSLGSDYFLFLMRCFSLGSVTIPAAGMGEIPRQMLSRLDSRNVRTGVRIEAFDSQSVTLGGGERIEASQVVCAFNPTKDPQAKFRKVTTLYFSADQDPGWGRWLVLVPPRLGFSINHLSQISAVSPDLVPGGKGHLISVSVVGSKPADAEKVSGEIEKLAGRTLGLTHLKTFEIPMALPVPEGGEPKPLTENGIFYCGDHRVSPSIDGALKSGRLVGEALSSK